VLLIPATANGRDLGPRVAGELELGMTGDCVGLGIDRAGRLIQTKPAYGGNIVSVIMGATTPQLATVRRACSSRSSRATWSGGRAHRRSSCRSRLRRVDGSGTCA
jgi:electron transfer flavoprotein alpha subunit